MHASSPASTSACGPRDRSVVLMEQSLPTEVRAQTSLPSLGKSSSASSPNLLKIAVTQRKDFFKLSSPTLQMLGTPDRPKVSTQAQLRRQNSRKQRAERAEQTNKKRGAHANDALRATAYKTSRVYSKMFYGTTS